MPRLRCSYPLDWDARREVYAMRSFPGFVPGQGRGIREDRHPKWGGFERRPKRRAGGRYRRRVHIAFQHLPTGGEVQKGCENVKTYVPENIYDAVTSRKDWPEIERDLKLAYGNDWELVPVKCYKESIDIMQKRGHHGKTYTPTRRGTEKHCKNHG